MENVHFSSSAEIPAFTGAEYVDALYTQELRTSLTVQDVREGLHHIVMTVGTNGEVGERAHELSEKFEEATDGGHGTIVLADNLGAGVVGRHHFASRKAEVRRDRFTPDAIVHDTTQTLGVVLEENGQEGHASQNPFARVNVIYNDALMSQTPAFEGEVGMNLRGIGIVREDVPEKDYREGERMVADLGVENVREYTRTNGSHAGEHMQKLVWKKATDVTYDQMLEEGAIVGMSSKEIHDAAVDMGALAA